MDASQVTLIIASVVGSGGVATLVTAFFTRRKIDAEAGKSGADAAQVLSASSVALLEPMERQLTRLSTQLETSQTHVDALDAQLRSTTADLVTANAQVGALTTQLGELTRQLQYYRDKYGPPTGELRPFRR